MSGKDLRPSDKRSALTNSILGLKDSQEEKPTAPSKSIVGSALQAHKEGLADRVAALEAERQSAVDEGIQLIEIDPSQIRDPLPKDRIAAAFEDDDFDQLRASILEHGQYVPIIVRRVRNNSFEIAAGRRRLAACKSLGKKVLARVQTLDDEAMLNLQYRENADREDVSTFERALWLTEVSNRNKYSTTEMAKRFGLSQPTVVEYLKIGRIPTELILILLDPRELTFAETRKIHAALKEDDGTILQQMVKAISHSGAKTTREQVLLALSTAPKISRKAQSSRAQEIKDGKGNVLLTYKSTGSRRALHIAPSIPEDVIETLMKQAAESLQKWADDN